MQYEHMHDLQIPQVSYFTTYIRDSLYPLDHEWKSIFTHTDVLNQNQLTYTE